MDNRGYTKSKENKHIADIPVDVYWHPEAQKYLSAQGGKERKKNMHRFLSKYPMFRVS